MPVLASLAALSGPAIALAQDADGALHPITAPQRLSQWLLANPLSPEHDPLGLSWHAAGERPTQQQWRDALVADLRGAHSALAGVVRDLPITGRVPLPSTDARWLQANPAADPVLRPGDQVQVPAQPGWVVVLLPSGHRCRVRHRPLMPVAPYLRACGLADAPVAWLVQPDGAVVRENVSAWAPQPARFPPAAGAWVWAPGPEDKMPTALSERLARFLATQGPAPTGGPWAYTRDLSPAEPRLRPSQAAVSPLVSNDWGVVGLLQTPTARMAPAGAGALTLSRVRPYGSLQARLQPLDWLEVSFGYLSVSDRRYGGPEFSGDQSYKDKSAHLKVGLLREGRWQPALAVGWRDLLGTGMFAGEYVVASKRFGAWDVSAGLGFGYVGGRGDVRNPLGVLSSRFDTRPGPQGESGGEFNARSYFRGRAAFFGGVQYQTPSARWVLKAEIDGNDYRHEPFGRRLSQRSPVNLAAVYRLTPWLDVTVGWERGREAVLALSAHTQLDGLGTLKVLDPRPLPVTAEAPAVAGDLAQMARDIERQSGAAVTAVQQNGGSWAVTLSDARVGYQRPVVEQAMRVVHRDAPPEVDRVDLRFDHQGVTLAQASVDRAAWAREHTALVPPSEQVTTVRNTVPQPAPSAPALLRQPAPAFTHGVGLSYQQNLGGPDAFVLFQLALDLRAQWRVGPGTWLGGVARLGLIDNYDKFDYTADSQLPRVRTYLREYLVTSRATLPHLQLTHLGQAGSDHHYLAYGGLLEPMFAGAGVEYLYRPVDSAWAWGLDLNRVRQRGFRQDLDLRDYQVTTGHVTAYWDTGWSDVLLKVSAGQYLAGDRGVTLDASRLFDNGVSIGAYVTRTDVSAKRFGEGSFDKGVYVTIPFDAMLPRSGPSSATITYSPLVRDGGARLARRYTLYEMTRLRGPRALTEGMAIAAPGVSTPTPRRLP